MSGVLNKGVCGSRQGGYEPGNVLGQLVRRGIDAWHYRSEWDSFLMDLWKPTLIEKCFASFLSNFKTSFGLHGWFDSQTDWNQLFISACQTEDVVVGVSSLSVEVPLIKRPILNARLIKKPVLNATHCPEEDQCNLVEMLVQNCCCFVVSCFAGLRELM